MYFIDRATLFLLFLTTVVAQGADKFWMMDGTAHQKTNCTTCPYFGCIQVTKCPALCPQRTSLQTCLENHNGKGCRWQDNKCIEDIQCHLTDLGGCSKGCSPCGEFRCVANGLECPMRCGKQTQQECGKGGVVNGIGCNWVDGRCITWDVVNSKPLPDDALKANKYINPILTSSASPPSTTTTISSSVDSSTASPTISTITSTSVQSPTSPSQPNDSTSNPQPQPQPQPQPKSSNISLAGGIALAILAYLLIFFISWTTLFALTRNKSSPCPRPLQHSRPSLPIYQGSSLTQHKE